jgi:hypothetical protein
MAAIVGKACERTLEVMKQLPNKVSEVFVKLFTVIHTAII